MKLNHFALLHGSKIESFGRRKKEKDAIRIDAAIKIALDELDDYTERRTAFLCLVECVRAHSITEANFRSRNARLDWPGISDQPVEEFGRPSEPLDSSLRNMARSGQQSPASVPVACSSSADPLPSARVHGLRLGPAQWTGGVSPAVVVHSAWTRRPLSRFESAICPYA